MNSAQFRLRKILWMSELQVPCVPFERVHHVACERGDRRVVGGACKPLRRSPPMGVADEVESERLRRLHGAHAIAVDVAQEAALRVDRLSMHRQARAREPPRRGGAPHRPQRG